MLTQRQQFGGKGREQTQVEMSERAREKEEREQRE